MVLRFCKVCKFHICKIFSYILTLINSRIKLCLYYFTRHRGVLKSVLFDPSWTWYDKVLTEWNDKRLRIKCVTNGCNTYVRRNNRTRITTYCVTLFWMCAACCLNTRQSCICTKIGWNQTRIEREQRVLVIWFDMDWQNTFTNVLPRK